MSATKLGFDTQSAAGRARRLQYRSVASGIFVAAATALCTPVYAQQLQPVANPNDQRLVLYFGGVGNLDATSSFIDVSFSADVLAFPVLSFDESTGRFGFVMRPDVTVARIGSLIDAGVLPTNAGGVSFQLETVYLRDTTLPMETGRLDYSLADWHGLFRWSQGLQGGPEGLFLRPGTPAIYQPGQRPGAVSPVEGCRLDGEDEDDGMGSTLPLCREAGDLHGGSPADLLALSLVGGYGGITDCAEPFAEPSCFAVSVDERRGEHPIQYFLRHYFGQYASASSEYKCVVEDLSSTDQFLDFHVTGIVNWPSSQAYWWVFATLAVANVQMELAASNGSGATSDPNTRGSVLSDTVAGLFLAPSISAAHGNRANAAPFRNRSDNEIVQKAPDNFQDVVVAKLEENLWPQLITFLETGDVGEALGVVDALDRNVCLRRVPVGQ